MTLFGSLFNLNVNVPISDQQQVQIRKSRVVRMVDACFVYPKEDSMKDKEIKEAATSVNLSYSCKGNGECNFGPVIEAIKQNAELKALGVKELTQEVLTTIDQNPELFPSSNLGGYVIQATGRPFLLVKNDSCKLPNPRYGFVDLTEVKKKLIFEAMQEKDSLVDLSIITTAAAFAGIGAFKIFSRFKR